MPGSFRDDVVTVTGLRRSLTATLESVRRGRPVTIMQGTKADLAIIRRTDFSSLEDEVETLRSELGQLRDLLETLEIESDKELRSAIEAGEAAIADGRTIDPGDLKPRG